MNAPYSRAPSAQEFRAMAETVRFLSSMLCSDTCRAQLLETARRYEAMAQEIEQWAEQASAPRA